LAAGLALAAVATASTETGLLQNAVGGLLLGLSAGMGSSILRRERREPTREP
jgi:hypothetical protein